METKKTTAILHLNEALSTSAVQSALNALFVDAKVTKVVHNAALTLQCLYNHFDGLTMKVVNVVDLQKLLLEQPQSPEGVLFANYFKEEGYEGGSASSTYHDAVAKHLQKDPKAWSHPMLAKKLLQYLAFQTGMYLECYKLLAKMDAEPAATAGEKQQSPASTTESNSAPKQQQCQVEAPAPVPHPSVNQKPSGKAEGAPTQDTSIDAVITYVNTTAVMNKLLLSRGTQLFKASTTPLVAVDFKLGESSTAVSGSQLLAITMSGWCVGTSSETIVLHLAPALDRSLVDSVLVPLLEDALIVKVMHNVHQAAYLLGSNAVNVKPQPIHCVDLQLAYEHLVDTKVRNADLELVAKHCAIPFDKPTYKEELMSHLDKKSLAWTRDNLARVLLQSLSHRTQVLLDCYSQLILQRTRVSSPQHLGSSKDEELVAWMTSRRWHNAVVNGGVPSVWFDSSADFAVRSLECLEKLQDTTGGPQGSSGTHEQSSALMPTLSLQCDLEPLLALLPEKYRQPILAIDGFRDKLVDICLDVGRVPHVYVGKHQRVPLVVPDRLSAAPSAPLSDKNDIINLTTRNTVSAADIAEVLESLGGPHKIGFDNRAGIDKQLHRISVMRSKTGNEIYGLTMRVGRALQHAANVLQDVLMSSRHRDKSVLLLGKPGCGKTTLIRDIARSVAATGENVCIIDTSNEIGGDGLVPHQCVGWARRMMVPSLEQQASVMIECVQNHTVETLVIDEIGRKAEVLAAGTVRQRGPRIIASGHGDFRSLIRNQDLKGLVGGVQQVTVGDDTAAKMGHKGKLQAERAGAPIFDIIVELDHVDRGRCQIIWDVGEAVDTVLRGEGYAFEVRKQVVDARGILSL